MNGRRRALVGAATTGAVLTAGAAAVTTVAAAFARAVVTPARHKPDDVDVLQVGPRRVVLGVSADTVVPGRYGVWTDGGRGHLRVGDVLEVTGERVTRKLLGVDAGTAQPGAGRWNQYFFAGTPRSALGLAHEDVLVPSEVGDLPAWLVPAAEPAGTWAVLVHGRGATREEALRALPPLRALGLTCLVPAYRNDADAPSSPARRYGLGDTEWHDVEAACRYALERGARRLVLVGWSMGGAIVLQLVARSPLAGQVAAVVLDGPVLDWYDVLDHQARRHRLPVPLGRYGLSLLGHPLGRRLVGLDGPVDLRRMDWVGRARELEPPVLLLHSDADDYVPSGPSARLAEARPDLVTFVRSGTARHTKEWNVDPAGWEDAVRRFLRTHLDGDPPRGPRPGSEPSGA
ncbi:alpha/beta hydrolase [Paenibacillus sp. TRM 82003]|uniref:alpha/beta hydrolase family protein n=1 Tax=Kineococcus sp. TRM81007 TaxID=2925831 RepID=UPI001F56174D|nr:alpha/beta fold hydrolase [Kineococcus sp. TRM81007]MCI2238953.1 alpha/beta hydrolase [Kineococcus sp. TRM81007]MCI3924372.1 alpha/beta hydrolase [Paenibacillus sp. TRM 82003]